MTKFAEKNRGWTRAHVALAFLVFTAAIACGLAVYSSASSLISLSREAFSVLFLPLFLSLVLAFLLDPLVTRLEKLFSRSGSIFVSYVLFLGLVSLSVIWLIPHWQEFWRNMGTDFPRYTAQVAIGLKKVIAVLHDRIDEQLRIQMQEIRRAGYRIDPEIVDREFAQFMDQKNLDREGLKASLEKSGYPFDYFMKQFENRVLLGRYLDEKVFAGTASDLERQNQYRAWFNNARVLSKVTIYDSELKQLSQNPSSGGSCCSTNKS